MVIQRRTGIVLILILAIVAIILALATTFKTIQIYIALVVSIIAILCSLISIFKEDFFPFQLKVLSGDVIFLNHQPNPAIDLVLTITFINQGYIDGIVELIALKVTNSKGNKKIYVACNELDNRLVFNLIRQPQTSTSAILPLPFSAFPLHARQSLKKHIGFAWSISSDFTRWEVERYKFELYLKLGQWKKLKKVAEFKHEMTPNDLNSYLNQESYYMAGTLERSLVKQINEL
ncbi:MAG: hypothetical protein AB1589_34125 [Cyanobacteriota bacterium]